MTPLLDLDAVRWNETGLVPVVVQRASSGEVLMVAWANREAVDQSLATGQMHYYSRQRASLWRKGETSGNTQRLVSLFLDCDGDTLLALVEPAGPACHAGTPTCFADASPRPWMTMADLAATIRARIRDSSPESYTARLSQERNLQVKKIGEEAAELVSSLATGDSSGVTHEAADLVYHVMVACASLGVEWPTIVEELSRRAVVLRTQDFRHG